MADAFSNFGRLLVPSSDDQHNLLSGSYLRLGRYVEEEEDDELPSEFFTSPSSSSCSGIFLKTNGQMIFAADENAYQRFKENLTIRVGGSHDECISNLSRFQARGILITTDDTQQPADSDIRIHSSKTLELEALGGDITMTAAGSFEQHTQQDAWTFNNGNAGEVTQGSSTSVFAGASMEFYFGVKLSVEMTVGISIVHTEISFTRMSIGLTRFEFSKTSIDLADDDVKLSLRGAKIEKTTANIEDKDVAVEQKDVEVGQGEVGVKNSTMNVNSARLALFV